MAKPVLLVVCTHNSARSQMVEAFFKKHGNDRFQSYSAGTTPKPIDPMTVQVMAEVGVDITRQISKHFNEYLGHLPVHTLIIACKDTDGKCPVAWPNSTRHSSVTPKSAGICCRSPSTRV